MMRALVFIFACSLFATDATLATETPAIPISGQQALQYSAHAMKTLNYRGTVVFLRNGKLEPMKYFHALADGKEQERLLSLNSPLREIIRDTDQVRCLYKATHKLNIDYRPFERSFLIALPDNLTELNAVYDIAVTGEEEIAMRPAYVVALKPKDRLRYTRKIWLDKQQFLPLKVAVYDFADAILEQLVFTELEVVETLPLADANPSTSQPPRAPQPRQPEFTVSSLPDGFKEVFITQRTMHNGQPVDHLLLSDGLAYVSLYWERRGIDAPEPHPAKYVQTLDGIHFFSRTLGPFELTVLGEVPAETVKLIAESVMLRKNSG